MKLYKQGKFLKINNRNERYQNRYKIRYSLFGIKFTIKNKKKIDFYLNKKNELKIKTYEEKYKSVIEELNSKRKNKKPILTVLLLTYNHVDTIEKCIQSLLDQDTKYEYIIKILDDASTDGTTDICFEYAQKYPEKIEYVLQPINTKGTHFREAIEKINTSYWAYIDGDDSWVSSDKIEVALDYLENNKDFVMYCNDFDRISGSYHYSIVHSWFKLPRKDQEISFENFSWIHPGARFHRHCIDWSKEFTEIIRSDYSLFILTLTKGKCYFEDKIKSVYNYNGQGVHSSKSVALLCYYDLLYDYNLNKVTRFKYNKFFINKANRFVFKKRILFNVPFFKSLIWQIFIKLYYFKSLYKDYKLIKQKYKNTHKRLNLRRKNGIN